MSDLWEDRLRGIAQEIEESETTEDAEQRGYDRGFYEGRQKWNWEQYFWGIFVTVVGGVGVAVVLLVIWNFIHDAAQQHTQTRCYQSGNEFICGSSH